MKSLSPPKSVGRSRIIPRLAVLCFLLLLVGIGAVPSYWTGHWSWAKLPPVANLKQINELGQTGLKLPGWKTLDQKTVTIAEHQWSVQAIERDNSRPVLLLLLPQREHKSQPEVEWVDLYGFGRWKTDSQSKIRFTVETSALTKPAGVSKLTPTPTAEVEARFFRARNQRQTFAVVQWYAWPGGGHPDPSRWFWVDQLAQLRRERVPWVAVCLQIGIDPLGNLEASRPLAESLAKMVQIALMEGSLKTASSDR